MLHFSDKVISFRKPQIHIGISYLIQTLVNPFLFDSNIVLHLFSLQHISLYPVT